MSYTKGEWKVEIVDATLPKHHKVYARINPSIGYVGWEDMGIYDDPGIGKKRQLKTLNEEALANAHLIAAAPNLYRAGKAFFNPDGTFNLHPANFAILKEALAKAEGK